MPTIKLEHVLKSPIEPKKINRNSKAEKKRLKELQEYIAGSRKRKKVDWERLNKLRF